MKLYWLLLKDLYCKYIGHRGKIISTAADGSGGIYYCHRCDTTHNIKWKETFIEIDLNE